MNFTESIDGEKLDYVWLLKMRFLHFYRVSKWATETET